MLVSRRLAVLALMAVIGSGCGGRPTAETKAPSEPGSFDPLPGSAAPASGERQPVTGTITVWTIAQGDDEVPLKAYEKAFEAQNPDADVKIVVVPEEAYEPKITTSLRAGSVPDVALMEPDIAATLKAGRWVDLTPHLEAWGIDPSDFNQGGLARGMVEADPSKGIYAIGDFLAGNVLVHNAKLFANANVQPPPVDRSLTYQEYDQICRAIGRPDRNPAAATFGCSVPDWGFLFSPVFGPDGRQALGNMNSPQVVQAFQVGAALINDGYAPGASLLDTLGESDLFAQGRIALTWTDFTEVDKYRKNGIEFGLSPFYVIEGQPDYVDVFTAAWGAMRDSPNPDGALAFIRFIATDAQRIRTEVSPDPPLSSKVAAEVRYGDGDPIKQQYLEVLKLAPPPSFVPPGVDAWDPAEVMRLLTVEGRTDAQAILDKMAAASQVELDQAWEQWESLGT